MKKAVIVAFVLFLGAAAYYFLVMQAPGDKVVEFSPVIPDAPASTEPGPTDPLAVDGHEGGGSAIAATTAEVIPLPDLTASDPLILSALAGLLGQAAVDRFVVPQNLISRLVATVDALGGRQVPEPLMPVQPLGSAFEANVDFAPEVPLYNPLGDTLEQYLADPVSYARYAPYLDVLDSINMVDLATIYRQQLPLFQQAYIELGYPEGDFNLRLLEIVDLMLATPEAPDPVRLIKPEAYYLFADPALEALAAGQKLMIRMGNSNAERAQAKLREFKVALTGASADP